MDEDKRINNPTDEMTDVMSDVAESAEREQGGNKGLKMGLLQTDQLRREIYKELMNDMVMFTGSLDVISKVENEVYPPNTPNNRDFHALYINMNGVFFGKRNDELKRVSNNPAKFENVMAIHFFDIEKDDHIQLGLCYHDGSLNDMEECAAQCADHVLAAFLKR